MTISVAGRPIQRLSGISGAARIILGFIDRGAQWFGWAVDDPHTRYHFDDDSALLAGVQTDLHGEPFLLLAKTGVIVGPAKLMTLQLSDLRALAAMETGRNSAGVRTRVAQILAEQRLVTRTGLASATAFLARLGVGDAPLFQCPSFDDRLAILELLNDPAAREWDAYGLEREAAAFAVGQAGTPQAFTDYYRAYLQCLAVSGGPVGRPGANFTRVRSVIDDLAPQLFSRLDCPRVDGRASPSEVAAAIQEWLMAGRSLGFARLSLAVQQAIANTSFCGPSGGDPRVVDAYMRGAQTLLVSGSFDEGTLGQDGTRRDFRIAGESGEAIVRRGADGKIALVGYRPPKPKLSARRSKSAG